MLEVISIFNTDVNYLYISNFFEYENNFIKKVLDELCAKGILYCHIDDKNYLYEFKNKLLKNLLYSRLSENNKREKHKITADILEKTNNDLDNKDDEIIYHLEKAENIDKVISYCIANADKMKNLKNIKEEMKYITKALALFNKSDITGKK